MATIKSNTTIKKLKSWEEFVQEIKFREEEILDLEKNRIGHVSPYFLYRGHSDSNWKLTTTLERYLNCNQFSLEDYTHILRTAHAPINSYTSKFTGLDIDLKTEDPIKSPLILDIGMEKLAYMTYLRHYGFPSPLLDWTKSPYVAAYFAFENLADNAHNVAIYAYLEHTGNGKGGWGGDPQVVAIGPYIATDKRHFSQQSHYTLCRKKVGDNFYYTSHEELFNKNGHDDEDLQDQWYKFLIPSSEKSKVLAQLDSMNINAYSLYHSEEALMRTIAYRELDIYVNKFKKI